MKNKREDKKKSIEESLIVYHPKAMGPARKWTEMSITTIGWFFWFLICRPLILAFLWLIGLQIFYIHMIRLGGLKGVTDVFWIYYTISIFIFVVMRGWNLYNVKKFRMRESRLSSNLTSHPELEKFMKMPPQSIDGIHNLRAVAVDFLENHNLLFKDISQENGKSYPAYFNPSKPDYASMRLKKNREK